MNKFINSDPDVVSIDVAVRPRPLGPNVFWARPLRPRLFRWAPKDHPAVRVWNKDTGREILLVVVVVLQ